MTLVAVWFDMLPSTWFWICFNNMYCGHPPVYLASSICLHVGDIIFICNGRKRMGGLSIFRFYPFANTWLPNPPFWTMFGRICSVVILEEISTNLACTFISIAILRFEIIEDNVHVMLNSARDDQIREKRLIKWDVKTIQSLFCLSAKQVGIYIKDVLQYQRTCLDSLDMT